MIVLCSGGMDSVTLSYLLAKHGVGLGSVKELRLLTVNYGQERFWKECGCAEKAAKKLGAKWFVLELPGLNWMLRRKDRTAPVAPSPFRNGVFLALAASLIGFIGDKDDMLAYGAYAGAHELFPDCRPDFIQSMSTAVSAGLGYTVKVFAPFSEYQKTDIVKLAASLDVPLQDTWSCYEGGPIHCGTCRGCMARKRGFYEACIRDPTKYADDRPYAGVKV